MDKFLKIHKNDRILKQQTIMGLSGIAENLKRYVNSMRNKKIMGVGYFSPHLETLHCGLRSRNVAPVD